MTARIGGGAKLGDKITTLVSQLPNLVDQVTIVLAFDDDSGDRTNCLTFIGQLHLLSSEGETNTQTLEQTQVTPGEHCQLQQNRLNCLLWILPHSTEDATDQ